MGKPGASPWSAPPSSKKKKRTRDEVAASGTAYAAESTTPNPSASKKPKAFQNASVFSPSSSPPRQVHPPVQIPHHAISAPPFASSSNPATPAASLLASSPTSATSRNVLNRTAMNTPFNFSSQSRDDDESLATLTPNNNEINESTFPVHKQEAPPPLLVPQQPSTPQALFTSSTKKNEKKKKKQKDTHTMSYGMVVLGLLWVSVVSMFLSERMERQLVLADLNQLMQLHPLTSKTNNRSNVVKDNDDAFVAIQELQTEVQYWKSQARECEAQKEGYIQECRIAMEQFLDLKRENQDE